MHCLLKFLLICYTHLYSLQFTWSKSYKQESQCSCKSCPSRKSVEKRLGVAELRGVRLITGPPDSSNQSMLSKLGSAKSKPGPPADSGAKCNSDVSIGEDGWSRIAELLSISLQRSIRGSVPSGTAVNKERPVVLSKKSSSLPGGLTELGCPCRQSSEE